MCARLARQTKGQREECISKFLMPRWLRETVFDVYLEDDTRHLIIFQLKLES